MRSDLTGCGQRLADAPRHDPVKLGDEGISPSGLLAAVAGIDIEAFERRAGHVLCMKPSNLFMQGCGARCRIGGVLCFDQIAQKQRQRAIRHRLDRPLGGDQQLVAGQSAERVAKCSQVQRARPRERPSSSRAFNGLR